MVQPAVHSVATEGEISAVLFAGTLSHAFRKGPMLALGGGRLDGYAGLEPTVLTAGQHQVVRRAMDAVRAIGEDRLGVAGRPLYARVDLVRLDDGREVVLEVELNEPSFFLLVDPDGAERFADAAQREAWGQGALDG
jgi:hypothetical protein